MSEDDPKPAKIPREQEIRISSVNVLRRENTKNHRTEPYKTTELVLRRGFDFLVEFNLTEDLNPDEHSLTLHFNRGASPSYKRETHFVSVIGRKASKIREWPGVVKQTNRETVQVAVSLPVDTPVGLYELEGEINQGEGSDKFVYPDKVAIVFNPWHEDDDVYISNEKLRQEYVMNESGLIWAGAYNNMFTWPWEFDQFASFSLPVAFFLLELKELTSQERRTAVQVSRALADMVNFNDEDGGILWGNWSGDYSDGTTPSSWSGSGAILEQFWRTKEVVKYAQCWVFGGTLTSVLRALGIPARPITNFASAHDTDANRSIDFYFDSKNKPLDDLSSDSIWNYHVWVEGWMERPDLRGAYGGWQALDATPQELSPYSDTYTLGPAPVAGIKEGRDLRYDSEFVISEVNADVKYYVRKKDNTFKLSGSNLRRVGKTISTKSVGDDEREDITLNYKYPEGSLEERAALEGTPSVESDVSLDIQPNNDIMVGEDFSANIVITSTASDVRTVSLAVRVDTVTYIGSVGSQILSLEEIVTVPANKSVTIPVGVPSAEYLPVLKEQLLLSISAFANVEETDFSFVDKETFRFKTPDIDITIGEDSSKVPLGETVEVRASFSNPLILPLTGVSWFVEGAGLTPPIKIDGSDIPANSSGEISFPITPTEGPSRYRYIVVTSDSRELPAVMGRARVHVLF